MWSSPSSAWRFRSSARRAALSRRRALEAGTLPASLDIDMKYMDDDMMIMNEVSSNKQVATWSLEKATTQQSLKDVEREKVSSRSRWMCLATSQKGRQRKSRRSPTRYEWQSREWEELNDGAGARREGQVLRSWQSWSTALMTSVSVPLRQSSYLYKAPGGICYESSYLVGYLKVKSLSTLMCMKTADRH